MARPRHPMPDDVAEALDRHAVREDYDARPAAQRNAYLGRIAAATRPGPRRKRIAQTLDELAVGGLYKGKDHPPSRKP